MVKLLKILGLIIVFLPVLFLAQCVYYETSQRNNLRALCEGIVSGIQVTGIIDKARNEAFEFRSETHRSGKQRDWFDREYDRILKAFEKDNNTDDSLTIVFAKPGIGYYACVIEQNDGLVKKARYLDRSS